MSFLDTVLEISALIAHNIWWPLIIIMLFSCGIYLSFVTKFVQFRRLGMAIKLTILGRKKVESKTGGDITPFQALMTALAATVGNGNIAGVATAIVAGGIGAPFWMWISALFGMATKYSEGLLGLHFRIKNSDGSSSGGAMYYMQNGIQNKFGKLLALWFSGAVIFMATFGSGNMAQSNSIALALKNDFNVDFYMTSLALFGLCIIILIGGIKRIADVADKIVPLMIVLYVGTGLIILAMHVQKIPEMLALIIRSAFDPQAMAGGVAGITLKEAIRFGVARGTLSNESGIGSCSIPAAASKGNEPAAQGLVAMMGTFIDTIIVCTMTTLVIASSNVDLSGSLNSVELTKTAFSQGLNHHSGNVIVGISSALFGFTTLIGWAYIGEQGFRFIFKQVNPNIYRVLFAVFAAIGAVLQGKYLDIVWNFGDIANAFMAIPNLIALFLLAGVVKSISNHYFKRYDSGEIKKNPFGY